MFLRTEGLDRWVGVVANTKSLSAQKYFKEKESIPRADGRCEKILCPEERRLGWVGGSCREHKESKRAKLLEKKKCMT